MIEHDNLEEFNDPANYDLEEAERSVPRIQFYTNLACGTGLAALPIAARGLPVTGVDLARPMLAYARVKAQRQKLSIDLVQADARQLHFDNSSPSFFSPEMHSRLFCSARTRSVCWHPSSAISRRMASLSSKPATHPATT